MCRLKCAERIMDGTCGGASQCGSHLPPPSSCAPEPPCVPPCRQCAPACLQPCRPCPPCPPPCRPCLPCPPNISQPACSDYSHTTTESYPNGCVQIPCRWDNTSYYNEGNDPTGNVVRQWNTSCHFANRQSGGSCSQPVGQCHCTLSVPCQQVVQQPMHEPTRGVIECQIPFRCRREVIITLPRDRCSPDRPGPTIQPLPPTPATEAVTPTTMLASPGTSAATTRGATTRRAKGGKGGGRKMSKAQRTPGRKQSTGKRGKSPKTKKSPGKKSPGKKSPRKKSPGGRKASQGRRLSQAKKMSQAKQIIFSCRGPDPKDYAVLPPTMDTSLFSNRSSQLRWMENRRRLCTLNRRNQASNQSSSELYRNEIDWKAEPEFESTDTTSSYLRKKQGQERAAKQMKKWTGPNSHA